MKSFEKKVGLIKSALSQTEGSRSFCGGLRRLPLLEGEGWGEGKGSGEKPSSATCLELPFWFCNNRATVWAHVPAMLTRLYRGLIADLLLIESSKNAALLRPWLAATHPLRRRPFVLLGARENCRPVRCSIAPRYKKHPAHDRQNNVAVETCNLRSGGCAASSITFAPPKCPACAIIGRRGSGFSRGESVEGFCFFQDYRLYFIPFPLTPTLSLGERVIKRTRLELFTKAVALDCGGGSFGSTPPN